MSLIIVPVWDTEENNRTWMTVKTLESIRETVTLSKGYHRLAVVDNGSTSELTKHVLDVVEGGGGFVFMNGSMYQIPGGTVIRTGKNLGTARAVNKALLIRERSEPAIKMDNDVVVHSKGWVDMLEDVISRDPTIGIVGLKRKDLIESPWSTDPYYKSEIAMLPHQPGQRWLVVEYVNHVMGTCQLYNPKLLEKIGFLYQMGSPYGFDDSLLAVRSKIAGFKNCFLIGPEIDHIDPGGGSYAEWKNRIASDYFDKYNYLCQQYQSGERSIYHGLDDE